MTTQAALTREQGAEFGPLYASVQQFYAHQMQLLDLQEAERWADTFTEDATFDVPTLAEPVRGRPGLIAASRAAAARLAEAGERHRHFMGMFDVAQGPDGALQVRSYTTVYASVIGGESRVHRVCVCEDVLVREGGRLLVSMRRVTRDDLA
ncbi:nuclear transport factor 2 family protein [Streptomyces sp. NPDC057474]|uniref:nuclear transport factor 2 family protein n=1 Tax=Streptomyces sp. NPDC057474 TaxID=3346144 RepID=UPI0036C5A322